MWFIKNVSICYVCSSVFGADGDNGVEDVDDDDEAFEMYKR